MVGMDSSATGALGIISFLFSSAGLIYAAVNHKRIRCRCCGRNMDVSVDVDSTEPVAEPVAEPVVEPEPEPIVVIKKERRSSLPPIIKKKRLPQIAPDFTETPP